MTRHHLKRRRIPSLGQIQRQLRMLAAQIGTRSAPAAAVAQALFDIEQSYGLTGQLVEVAHAQREQIESLIRRLDALTSALTEHDKRLEKHDGTSVREREEISELLVQLRSLMREQVRKTEDLARAVGERDEMWSGEERRNSISDRRRE